MKPLHHYLRRFCSEQVQILLQRMDDHFADEFAEYDSKWDAYVSSGGEAFSRYTKLEAFCVTRTRDEQMETYKRQQMLDGILVRTMSPAKNRYDFEREQERERQREERVWVGPAKKMVVNRAQFEMMKKLANQNDGHIIDRNYAAQAAQHQQHVELHNKLANWLKP